jgi:hypothetical protein
MPDQQDDDSASGSHTDDFPGWIWPVGSPTVGWQGRDEIPQEAQKKETMIPVS